MSLEDDDEVFLRTLLPAAAERRSGATTAADARPAGADARQETALLREVVALALMAVAFMVVCG